MKLFKALPLFQLKKCISDVFNEHFISSGYIFENDKAPPAGSNQNAPQTSSMEHFTNQEVLNAPISFAARKSSGADHLESKLLLLAAILLFLIQITHSLQKTLSQNVKYYESSDQLIKQNKPLLHVSLAFLLYSVCYLTHWQHERKPSITVYS